jgi:hypothetical protein
MTLRRMILGMLTIQSNDTQQNDSITTHSVAARSIMALRIIVKVSLG